MPAPSFRRTSSPLAASGAAQTPNNGTSISTEVSYQFNQRIIPDGSGGMIVAWEDYRNSPNPDVFAQRLNAAGIPLWALNGVPVCQAISSQISVVLASDGAGGAIIVWEDYRSGGPDIFAQRLDASGAALWPFNGVSVVTMPNDQRLPQVVPDGAGGVIIAWQDLRSGGYDIYAQRVSNSGQNLWTVNGVAVTLAGNTQQLPVLVPDAAGGTIVAWEDSRTGAADIYAQHLDASGIPQWQSNGLEVCIAAGNQTLPAATDDGTGGIILTWADTRNGPVHIYTQRLNPLGVTLWTVNGVALCSVAGGTARPTIARSGTGGAIVTWEDYRTGTADVYAQRVDGSGLPQWTGNGVGVCTVSGPQTAPTITGDSSSGAWIAWQDQRTATQHIHVQHVNNAGVALLELDGKAVTQGAGHRYDPRLAADGAGGVVLAWRDDRYSVAPDVFGQRLRDTGDFVFPDSEYPRLLSVRDVPNDQGGRVKLSWTATNQDLPPFSRIESYWIWRSVPGSVAARPLAGAILTRDPIAARQPDRERLFVTSVGGQDYFWEFLASQPAGHLMNYSYVAATTSDSLPGSNPYTAFMIQAQTAGGTQWWFSNADSGYSVDNLAPGFPGSFTAEFGTYSTSLHWSPGDDPDLDHFRLHRGSSDDFTPAPENMLLATADTSFVDFGPPIHYYKLAAVDVHGNVGPHATIAPAGQIAVSGGRGSRAVHLASPTPNPTHEMAAVRFELPTNAWVRLSVYDPAGRHVRELTRGWTGAGSHRTTWDLRNGHGFDAPPGLYLLKLEALGESRTVRLAVTR